MALRLKPRFSLFQFSIFLRHFRPTIWRRVQVKDCTLRELHAIILAAFGFQGEHTFRFSRRLPECLDRSSLNGAERPESLAPETWLSQLVPVDGTGEEKVGKKRCQEPFLQRFLTPFLGPTT